MSEPTQHPVPAVARTSLIEPPDAYPELLGDLLTNLARELKAAGLDVTSASDIAWRATEKVRDRWSGQTIYVPQAITYETRKRYEQIWNEFTGDNVPDLARRYRLSEQAVYAAIRHMREEHKRRAQLTLDL